MKTLFVSLFVALIALSFVAKIIHKPRKKNGEEADCLADRS